MYDPDRCYPVKPAGDSHARVAAIATYVLGGKPRPFALTTGTASKSSPPTRNRSSSAVARCASRNGSGCQMAVSSSSSQERIHGCSATSPLQAVHEEGTIPHEEPDTESPKVAVKTIERSNEERPLRG